jgi:flagella basal body P-ring formation protein FlgA
MRTTLLTLLICAFPWTTDAQHHRPISVVGRPQITVTTPVVRLGDLAEVSARGEGFDQEVISLNKIVIEKSPPPGGEETVVAHRLLEALQEQGVDTNAIGYTLPRVMKVRRASRALTDEEIRTSVVEALQIAGRDVDLRDIEMSGSKNVFPGALKIRGAVDDQARIRGGSIPVILSVTGEDQETLELRAIAKISEFRELPIAKHALPKGSIVSPSDVVMARLNAAALPKDVAAEPELIIGLETSKPIHVGAVFRSSDLRATPVIPAGGSVVLRFHTPYFEATAAGTALEAGAEGQEIRVRNNESKKIIRGRVIEPGIVSVNP